MSERRYHIRLTGGAWVKSEVDVSAHNEKEARAKALEMARGGAVVWEYDEYMDSIEPEAEDV